VLLFAPGFTNVAWALLITLGYGLIGLLDDFIIVVTKRSTGLKARHKLIGQTLLALAISLYVFVDPKLGSEVVVPWGSGLLDLGWLFVPIAVVASVAMSNAVNLTDGLDGLAAGTTGIAAVAFAIMTYMAGYTDLAVFAAALAGACLGFSWFNAHPAQVFMGDTGALALGGALAGIALLSKTMFFLPIVGGIFVAETLSDVIQVTSYKLTRRRVFKMAPLHHHFELSGWKETKIVIRFWIIAIILAVAGVGLYLMSI
jgi:phospho-N-acetylmuramoyl-pentapeptide-transferase